MIKNYQGKSEDYAKGGGVLGRTKDFMKEPDRFRTSGTDGKFQPKPPEETEDNFAKDGGRDVAPAAKGKSLAPIVPKK